MQREQLHAYRRIWKRDRGEVVESKERAGGVGNESGKEAKEIHRGLAIVSCAEAGSGWALLEPGSERL